MNLLTARLTLRERRQAIAAGILVYVAAWASAAGACTDPVQCGQWSSVIVPQPCSTAETADGYSDIILLKNGKVMLLYASFKEHGSTFATLFNPDPQTGEPEFERCFPRLRFPYNVFCGSHNQLPDGRILFAGGVEGEGSVLLFDPDDELVDLQLPSPPGWLDCTNDDGDCVDRADPPAGYPTWWYPFSTTMPSGKSLILGGRWEGSSNGIPVIYDHVADPSDAWTAMPEAQHCSNLFDPSTPCGPSHAVYPDVRIDSYPHMFGLSDGRFIWVGGFPGTGRTPATHAWALNTDPPNPLDPLSVRTASWARVTFEKASISGQATLLIDPHTLYQVGGVDQNADESDDHVYRLDLTQWAPDWQQISELSSTVHGASGNGESDTYYLVPQPDGSFVATGLVLTPEGYDPAVPAPWKQFQDMTGISSEVDPTQFIPRGKHSSAVLLPDGRLIMAGGVDNSTGSDVISPTFELFSPPYLFNASGPIDDSERPSFNTQPRAIIGTGTTFTIDAFPGVGASSVTDVSLIRLGSTTHSVDFNTRALPLSFTGAIVSAPRSAEEAPPGYYMLFLVNDNGHPAKAPIVQVWGIVQSSISHDEPVVLESPQQFHITVRWRANQITTANNVHFYSPSGLEYPATVISSATAENGRFYEATYEVGTSEAGIWTYEVESTYNATTSRSYRTTRTSFEVAFASGNAAFGTDDLPPAAEDNSKGVAWGDFDADGDPDLFVANNPGTAWLLRNDSCRLTGGGSCVTTPSGADASPLFTNANTFLPAQYADVNAGVWGNYDNENGPDLFLARASGQPDVLLRNEGEDPDAPGSWLFSDATGTLGSTDNSPSASWADFNNDGLVDLYVVKNTTWGRLYRNNGDGTFTDVTSGDLTSASKGQAAAWADYDKDGDVDLYVVKTGSGSPNSRRNQLFRNDGNETFVDMTFDPGASILADTGHGQAAAWGDYDNDGDMDLMLTNDGDGRKLFQNQGDGSFLARQLPAELDGEGRGVAWGDYDGDGDLDIYVTYEGINELLQNNNGTFVGIYDPALSDDGVGRGAAWGDFNLDGDLDLAIANEGGLNRLVRTALSSKWLGVSLQGTVGDMSAVGAKVECVVNGSTQLREISGGAGFSSQPYDVPVFSLSAVDSADSVVVTWSTGEERVDVGVAADQVVVVQKWLEQSSVNVVPTQFCQNGNDLFKLVADWTSTVQPDSIALEVFFPGASSCDGFVGSSVGEVPSGTSHHLEIQAPCSDGNWFYAIRMFKDGGTSRLCGSVEDVQCPQCTQCPPEGCQVE